MTSSQFDKGKGTVEVTHVDVKQVGEAPAEVLGDAYQSIAHSTGILFENAVSAQQQQNTLTQAAANQGVMQIYSLDTTAAAGAEEKIVQTAVADELTGVLSAAEAMKVLKDDKK
ncbi:RebB family R body protein [Paraburkholderia jirisanensis]